ncbi:hypothetical protein ACIBEJ_47760 [Nonomuraea sp. NPDC050790]|uniref:hypothetical protein n=1 Tax=Nonomuraea sp. NPDC050790 TaxID=3364371 RepID=UPI00379F881A
MLIDAGIDVERKTSHGQTPLSHAASRGTTEIIEHCGFTPLHEAAELAAGAVMPSGRARWRAGSPGRRCRTGPRRSARTRCRSGVW